MGNVVYRTLYVGDEEGEIEFCEMLRDGWNVVVNSSKRVCLIDNMLALFKEQNSKHDVTPLLNVDAKAHYDYYIERTHLLG